MKVKKLDISAIRDIVDNAIIRLCINGSSRTVIHKTVFLYLYSITKTNNYSFKEILTLTGFRPDLYAPFSDFVDGEIGILWSGGDIELSEDMFIFKTNENKLSNYSGIDNEMNIISDILELTKLTNREFLFYVYYHPSIPKYIKKYFKINAEIKCDLIKNKEEYIKALQNKGIMDDDSAELVRYDSYFERDHI